MFFRSKSNGASGPVAIQNVEGVDARALRRVKILGGMSDEQLQKFADFHGSGERNFPNGQ